MRRAFTFFASAALTLLATSAFAAGGINLSWNDCGTSGVLQRNFACSVNSGSNSMISSVVTGVAMNELNGQESVMDMQTNQAALSDWWQFNTGGCRFNSTPFLRADFNFTTFANCFDPWGNNVSGGMTYTPGFGGPNRARVRTACAVNGTTLVNGVDEYYIQRILITNARSTGVGACSGCQDGACIVLNSTLLTQPAGVGDYLLTNPLNRNWVQWQGGAGDVPGGCPAATPTQNRTWGAVKSLYR